MGRFALSCLLVFCLFQLSLVQSRTDPKELDEQIERGIVESYKRVPPASSIAADVLATFVDSLVDERLETSVSTERETERKHVMVWLTLLSGWASLNSFKHLAQLLGDYHSFDRDSQVCIDGDGATLGDFLYYMSKKGHFRSGSFSAEENRRNVAGTWKECVAQGSHWYDDKTCVLLVDSMMLRRFHDEPEFRNHIEGNKTHYQFVFPFGYEGINVFNTRLFNSPEKRESWFAKLPDPKALVGLSGAEALKLMREQIMALTKLRLPESLRDVDSKFVYPKFALLDDHEATSVFAMSSPQIMEKYLLPNFRRSVPTFEAWHRIFDMWSDVGIKKKFQLKYKNVRLEIVNTLAQHMWIYTMEMMSDACADIYKRLPQPVSNLQFYIPIPMKSYGLSTLIFFMNHPNLSTSQIWTGLELKRAKEGSSFVVLDDFAGTGKSLCDIAESGEIADNIFRKGGRLILSALVQTLKAHERISNVAVALSEKYGNSQLAKEKEDPINVQQQPTRQQYRDVVESVPGVQLTAEKFQETKYSEAWTGGGGFADTYSFIAFPTMAADNNCGFFSGVIAPLFTLDGRGIKQYKYNDVPPRFQQFLQIVLEMPHSPATPALLESALREFDRNSPRENLHTYLCPPHATGDTDNSDYSDTAPPLAAEGTKQPKYPVVVVHESDNPQAPHDVLRDSHTISNGDDTGAVYSWVLPYPPSTLLFGLLNGNPLQLGVGPRNLAPHYSVYASGIARVSATKLELLVDTDSTSVSKKQFERLTWALKYLVTDVEREITVTSLDLDQFLRDRIQPTPKHFKEACEKGYEVKLDGQAWSEMRDGEFPKSRNACVFEYTCE